MDFHRKRLNLSVKLSKKRGYGWSRSMISLTPYRSQDTRTAGCNSESMQGSSCRACEKHGEPARDRFEHEIESMGDFAHYLLLISDFIVEAKRQGILTNTRGSAANSILCFCLKIHDKIQFTMALRLRDSTIRVERNCLILTSTLRLIATQISWSLFKSRVEELEGKDQVVGDL